MEECKELLDREGYRMLDIRPFKAYEREHLTKPAQCTTNAPWGDGEDVTKLIKRVELVGLRPLAKLLVADFDGERNQAAADALFQAGFTEVICVKGGYNGWRSVYTTCGRVRPPQGKWVSTGKGGESLKSGLTLDPSVAAAYEENWGKAPPTHGETGESIAGETGEPIVPSESMAAQRIKAAKGVDAVVPLDQNKTYPPMPKGPKPDRSRIVSYADVTLEPLAMDVEINAKRAKAAAAGLTDSYKEPVSGDGTWGSNWDEYLTEDETRTPYYVNRVSGKTQWEKPKRWWSSGRWIDAEGADAN